MANQLVLRAIVCQTTNDVDGKDEVYLKVNGRKVVGDVSLRNGHTYHTVDNHGDYLHFPIEESGRLKIQLYEADPSPNSDDLLGKWDEWGAADFKAIGDFKERFGRYSRGHTFRPYQLCA